MITPTVFPDAAQLGRALATEIADGIAAAAHEGRTFTLGCPGGRSPRSTYAQFAEIIRERSLDLSSLEIFMMDDYVVTEDEGFRRVPTDAHFSVEAVANEDIVRPWNRAAGADRGLTPDRVHFPDPSNVDAYERLLESRGGVDLFILASGDTDGHIAFNPPGSELTSRTRVVEIPLSTRLDNLGTFPDFHSLDEVPTFGVTVGVGTILTHTHRAVLVAPGASTQTAVRRISQSTAYDPQWPASVLVCCREPALYTDVLGVPT